VSTIPVVAGLAVGIAFVVLFASFFDSAAPIVQRKFHAELSIEGLKDRYSVGERIDFTVRAAGYGTICGYPDLKVIDWDRNGKTILAPERGITLLICDLDAANFDRTWKLSELGVANPITIDEVGRYSIVISFGTVGEAVGYFIVDDTVGQAIDKTRNLAEVTAFLTHYPNADATAYFVTTCADDSCDTLIRVPSIIEYWHRDSGKTASLRISVDLKDSSRPTFIQILCGVAESEEASEIHGFLSIDRKNIAEFLQNENRCPK
jgi:hypothetical protein